MKKIISSVILSIMLLSCQEILNEDPETSISTPNNPTIGEVAQFGFTATPDDGGSVFWHINNSMVTTDSGTSGRSINFKIPCDGTYEIRTEYFTSDSSGYDECTASIFVPSPGTDQY